MKVTDEQIVEAIKNYVADLDTDELARIAGELLGGECVSTSDFDNQYNLYYSFEPNNNYFGAFGNIE